MQVAPLAMRVEQTYIVQAAHSARALVGPYAARLAAAAPEGPTELLRAADVGAAVAANTRLVSSHQVYVEFLYMAPMHVLVSFMPAPYHPAAHASTLTALTALNALAILIPNTNTLRVLG